MSRQKLISALISEYFQGKHQALTGLLDYLVFEKHIPIDKIARSADRILAIPEPIAKETILRLLSH